MYVVEGTRSIFFHLLAHPAQTKRSFQRKPILLDHVMSTTGIITFELKLVGSYAYYLHRFLTFVDLLVIPACSALVSSQVLFLSSFYRFFDVM